MTVISLNVIFFKRFFDGSASFSLQIAQIVGDTSKTLLKEGFARQDLLEWWCDLHLTKFL